MSGRTTPPDEAPDASSLNFAIVAARFHEPVTSALVEGALACFAKYGALDVVVRWVPGSFELPLACRELARASARRLLDGGIDGIVALGCVVRGETPHFDFVAAEAAHGLMRATLETGVPMSFGVLTTETMEQALARAGGEHGNKGWDSALGCIEMATLLARVRN